MTVTEADAGFLRQADPYRRELLAHCYRMLGSTHDAEDLVQETYLRAWRAYDSFEGKSSLRTWLHRIATNACLTALESRRRRPLPTGLGQPSSSPADELVERTEISWLEPVPDALLGSGHGDADGTDPAAIVASRSTVRLAFVAALQYLPPRQRAVLLLRDVVGWRAAEVAEALDTSTAAVNSILQRARAHLREVRPSEDGLVEPSDPEQRALLDRYAHAMEDKDVATIVRLLTAEASWEMPPFTGWYQGADDIGYLIEHHCPGAPGQMRMVPTRANGQPAFGLYLRAEDGTFRPFQLQVLDLRAEGVVHVTAFFDLSLFAVFGLPAEVGPPTG